MYFHIFGSPLEKITNGNHFGYLEPSEDPNIMLNNNTIQEVTINEVNNKTGDSEVASTVQIGEVRYSKRRCGAVQHNVEQVNENDKKLSWEKTAMMNGLTRRIWNYIYVIVLQKSEI